MLHETADKPDNRQGHLPVVLPGFGIFVTKSHLPVSDFDDTLVADSHPVGVPGHIWPLSDWKQKETSSCSLLQCGI